ncbi:hypothetical protein [Zarconia navalis]
MGLNSKNSSQPPSKDPPAQKKASTGSTQSGDNCVGPT